MRLTLGALGHFQISSGLPRSDIDGRRLAPLAPEEARITRAWVELRQFSDVVPGFFREIVSTMINPESTAKLGSHPLHPMLIPFPVAFLVTALVTDLAFIGTSNSFWAKASMWLLGAGVVMALLAAAAGFIDFFGERRIRALNDAWYHMIGNLTAVIIALVNFLLRYNQGAEAAIKPWGCILSLVVVGILLFKGWKGWGMVYSHHVAVLDAPGQTGSEPVKDQSGSGRHAA